jgi:adenylate cyclase class 2
MPDHARFSLGLAPSRAGGSRVGERPLSVRVLLLEAIGAILVGLGLERLIAYTKRCENFTLDAEGHRIVATMVTVPELDGTFIEIETLVPDSAPVDAAHAAIHRVLADLGLSESDLEPAFYIDMISARREAA